MNFDIDNIFTGQFLYLIGPDYFNKNKVYYIFKTLEWFL